MTQRGETAGDFLFQSLQFTGHPDRVSPIGRRVGRVEPSKPICNQGHDGPAILRIKPEMRVDIMTAFGMLIRSALMIFVRFMALPSAESKIRN